MDYAQLMEELVSNPGYIDGRRRFPRTFTPYDALVIGGAIHDHVDAGCEARAHSAQSRRLTIACVEGCNYCCEQAVMVFLPEAIRIAEWLKLDENAEAREAFLATYPAWLERAGDGLERIAAAKGDEQFAAHVAHWKKKVMCAFNHGGRCVVYAVRPLVCRACHALESNDRCKAENFAGELPKACSYPPLEKYIEKAQSMDRAMHHALGGERN